MVVLLFAWNLITPTQRSVGMTNAAYTKPFFVRTYVNVSGVRLIGVEPAGEGLDSGKHGAPLERGKVGILHGSKSYVLLGEAGDVEESYSISAGLESSHALAYALKIAESATGGTLRDGKFSGLADVLEACGELALLVNLSGRGDKDVEYVHNILGDFLYEDPRRSDANSRDRSARC